ncbi:MAG: hypothetical protein GY745_19455 [Actinomycetia bacterium]|nr:hypothetical protein [Actinomycetes bacterium]
MSTDPTPSIAPPLIGATPDDPPVLTPALASALLTLIVNTDRARRNESANPEDSRHSDGIAS